MRIGHEDAGIYVELDGSGFGVALDASPVWLNREELSGLRAIIYQALNTSAEELEASE